jgi:hypothetical protein
MITREKPSRGEGELVEENPEIGSRKRTSQSEKMTSKEGLSHDEKEFRKTIFQRLYVDIYCNLWTQIKVITIIRKSLIYSNFISSLG